MRLGKQSPGVYEPPQVLALVDVDNSFKYSFFPLLFYFLNVKGKICASLNLFYTHK